jgi:hypothetical protein
LFKNLEQYKMDMKLNRLLIQLKPWASLSEYTAIYPPRRELEPIEVVIAKEIASLQGVNMPKWLSAYDDITIDPVDAIAMSGHLPTLKWMKDNTATLRPPTLYTAEIAALKGHFEVVQWLYDNYPLDKTDSVVKLAVLSGNKKLIKWAYHEDFPFDGVREWARDRDTRELAIILFNEQNRNSCMCQIS